jgi:acyl-CoA thioesterase I
MNCPSNRLLPWISTASLPLIAACLFLLSAPAAEKAGGWAYKAQTLRPFWLSRTMEGESVLFVKEPSGEQPRASLLFEPARILSVRSSSGEIVYKEGRDYLWQKGTQDIVLPPGSSIPYNTPAELRRPAGSQPYRLTHRDGNGEILFGAGHEYHDMQVVITYKHRSGAWNGPVPAYAGGRLPRVMHKLRHKQSLVIALLGDSISTGCNASGWAKTAPFQPAYQELFVMNLKARYKGSVTLTNFAVGGTDTAWGLGTIGKVAETRPDLLILAFGMNDAAGRPAIEYGSNILRMVEAVKTTSPETEFILVATMLGNRDWAILNPELFPAYRDELARLQRPGIALADMTSMWDALLKRKHDWDLTGNGVNHPNDFGHRVYAQILSALVMRNFLR